MGAGSWWHWAIVIAVVLILFGGKKIPELMKGIGTGIKGFKKAIKDDDEESSSVANTSGQTIIEASTSQPQISQSTRGRARPKGSSTKTSVSKATASVSATSSSEVDSPKKRGRSKKA
ncbi:twin-arginine translocase TatA/TatE family subunit [Helicobacter sp. MIT 01-3238]|nr:twin-arginine translocase TatA/TatE family subunit [Helicobacter sp. MIT 01-3238]